MSRSLLYLLTGASVLALGGCTQMQGSTNGQLTDQEKQSFNVAQGMVNNGSPNDARPIYEELARHPESAVQADMALASIDRRTGQPEDAVSVMKEAQKLEPGNEDVLTQLGFALIAAGHPEEAVNIFDELIAMQPDNANMYNAKAVAFDKAGNHVAAQEIYQQALSLAPNSLVVRNNLAMSYILNDQVNDAINLLEPLVKQKTANATVRQNLALAYGIKGDKQRAMALNMQDVTADQAKDNMRFYDKYAQAKREHASVDLEGSLQPVISDTKMPMNSAKSAAKKNKTAKSHAEPMVSEPVQEEEITEPVTDTTTQGSSPIGNDINTDEAQTTHSVFGTGAVYDYPTSRH